MLFPIQYEEIVTQALREGTLAPGKRLRPLLLLLALGDLDADPAIGLDPACALEMIHAASLFLDDMPCMDDDDLRRGKPTVHKVYDEAMAVLTGDSLFAVAFELLADEATHEDPFVRSELVLELARASGPAGMAGGQVMDIAAETQTFDLPTTTRLQQLKTGALIGFSVEAGAIMGKVGPATRLKLKGYARDLGLAFQIADDIIDISSVSGDSGKVPGTDLREGVPTLPIIYVLRGTDPGEARLRETMVEEIKKRVHEVPA